MRCSLVLFVLLSVALATPVSADQISRCRNQIAGLQNDLTRDSAQDMRQYESRIERAIDRAISRQQELGTTREELEEIVEFVNMRRQVDYYREQLIDNNLEALQALIDQPDDEFECPSVPSLRFRVNHAANSFELGLNTALDDIRNRFDIRTMGNDEGLAIIAFYSFGNVSEVRIDRVGALGGGHEFGPILEGQHFEVVKLKAGTYEWDRITRQILFYEQYMDYSDRDLQFTVSPGVLNYTGVFIFKIDGNLVSGTLNDRTSIVLAVLEQNYPGLIERFDIVNGLVPEDRFIEFYFSEKNALEAGGDGS